MILIWTRPVAPASPARAVALAFGRRLTPSAAAASPDRTDPDACVAAAIESAYAGLYVTDPNACAAVRP